MGMFSKWKSAPVEARMSDSLRERMQAAARGSLCVVRSIIREKGK